MVESGGSTAGVTSQTFLGRLGNPKNYHLIEYASQKVRGDVVGAGQRWGTAVPITLVIAGGEPPFRTPVIIGLVGGFDQYEELFPSNGGVK